MNTISQSFPIESIIKNPLDKIGNNIDDLDKIDQLAVDYEAFFYGIMFEQMYVGVKAEKPFGGGNAEIAFRSMLIHAQAQEFAETKSTALGEDIKKQIIQLYQRDQETYAR